MRHVLKIKQTKQFKKDLKTAFRQGCDLARLEEVIDILAAEQPLDKKYRDHALSVKLRRFRECHIALDWLLIYEVQRDILVLALTRLGSHAKLFGL